MNKRLFDLIQDFSNALVLDYAFIRKRDENTEIYVVAFKEEIIDDESLYDDSITIELHIEDEIVKEPTLHLDAETTLTLTYESLNKLYELINELKKVKQQ